MELKVTIKGSMGGQVVYKGCFSSLTKKILMLTHFIGGMKDIGS